VTAIRVIAEPCVALIGNPGEAVIRNPGGFAIRNPGATGIRNPGATGIRNPGDAFAGVRADFVDCPPSGAALLHAASTRQKQKRTGIKRMIPGECSSGPDYRCCSRCFARNELLNTPDAFPQFVVERQRSEWSNRGRAAPEVWAAEWEVSDMALGTVKWFNDAKGYGFISRADDGKDVFVHYSSITGEGFRTLNQGQTVEYEESNGPKGLFAAKVLKAM
jgi:CspA family cold shock protein